MDGRHWTVLLTLVLPVLLIGVTAWKYASNPLAIVGLFTVMIGGALYLLTYNDSF